MDLILWRHAEAELLRPGQDDMERGLTPKGERQARRMAAWLNERLPPIRRASSSARRCGRSRPRRRWAATSRPSSCWRPGRGVDDLLEAARWPDSGEPVLIVGHQPTLGLVAARLLAGVEQAWPVKKGAVWWLARREREGVAQVTLQAVQGPDRV